MTIAFRSIGVLSAGGTTTVSVALPAGDVAGDMLIAARCVWTDVAGTASNESGWTAGGDLHGGTGTAIDDHTTRARADYKEATGSDTDPTVFDQAGTLSGAVGRIAAYSKTAAAWDAVATATGDDNTHGADRSVTGSTNIAFAPGDMLIAIVAIDTDAALATPTWALTASGITFGTTTAQTSGTGRNTGNDGNVHVIDALVTAGTGTVAPVLTLTTTTNTCGPVSFIRLREVAAEAVDPYQQDPRNYRANIFFRPSGEAFQTLGDATTPTAGATETADAESAAATGTANNPSVKVEPVSQSAAGTGTANNPSPRVAPVTQTATATAAANDTTAAVSPTPATATATGTANNPSPSVAPTPATATATGTAFDPTVQTGSFTNAQAQTATATGTAFDPSVSVSTDPNQAGPQFAAMFLAPEIASFQLQGDATTVVFGATSANAETATATGAANNPSVAVAPVAGTATATGTTNNPSPSVATTAGSAAGAGAANNPTIKIAPVPATATATGEAFNPTVQTGSFTNAQAQTATATGTANNPGGKVAPVVGTATATGTANAPSPFIRINAGQATATSTANNPTITRAGNPQAQTATATGIANDAHATIAVLAAAAEAIGAAFDATIPAPYEPAYITIDGGSTAGTLDGGSISGIIDAATTLMGQPS